MDWRSAFRSAVNPLTVSRSPTSAALGALGCAQRSPTDNVCFSPSGDVSATEFFDQRAAIDAEQLGRAVAVAAGSVERLGDEPLFELGQKDPQVDAAHR